MTKKVSKAAAAQAEAEGPKKEKKRSPTKEKIIEERQKSTSGQSA